QARIKLIRRNEIKIGPYIGKDLFSRRQVTIEHLEHGNFQSREGVVEDCSIERLFVFEVVVKQGFVHSSLARDRIGASPGNSVLCEFPRRCLENGGAALVWLAARSLWAMPVLPKPK